MNKTPKHTNPQKQRKKPKITALRTIDELYSKDISETPAIISYPTTPA